MKIILQRRVGDGDTTIGDYYLSGKAMYYSCEDEARTTKVYGETRIPSGAYEIKLRTYGGHHERYKAKYSFHIGMLELQNVKGFTDILIHIGNSDDDTAGCLLIGYSSDLRRMTLKYSELAYIDFYQRVIKAIGKGEKISIEIRDELIIS